MADWMARLSTRWAGGTWEWLVLPFFTQHRFSPFATDAAFVRPDLGPALPQTLLPLLRRTPRARVVTLSSLGHWFAKMDFDNLGAEKGYNKVMAYAQSKLANLLFTTEFQRRLDATGVPVLAMAAHPGYANTALQGVGPTMRGATLQARFMEVGNRIAAQSPEMGALPTL